MTYFMDGPLVRINHLTTYSYFTGDIKLPSRVHEAMQMQVEAERRKRAAILESEGVRAADINVAEGKRQARILASGEISEFFRILVSEHDGAIRTLFFRIRGSHPGPPGVWRTLGEDLSPSMYVFSLI